MRALRRMRIPALLLVLGAIALADQGPALATPLYGTASNNTPASCPAATPNCPSSDAFYTPPANLATYSDGAIVDSRAATVTEPGLQGFSSAHTISYRSEDAFGAPVLDTATVFIPSASYTGGGPRPLVSLQYAIDSLGAQCTPSYAMGHPSTDGTVDAESANVTSLLSQGYVVVTPDHYGPAMQFIVGQQEGHATLDGIRAAKSLPAANLNSSTPVGMTGYSGGAHATGWASELAAGYAPDLNIVGAAEGGTPADLGITAKYVDGTAFFGLALLATEGLDRGFPAAGIHAGLNALGQTAFADISTGCVDKVASYPLQHFDQYTTQPALIDSAPVQATLAHEQLGQVAPGFPILNYHAVTDQIVPFTQDQRLVQDYCSHGTPVEFFPLVGDHVTGEPAGAPLVLSFLQSRFSGSAPTNDCSTVSQLPCLPQVPSIGGTTPSGCGSGSGGSGQGGTAQSGTPQQATGLTSPGKRKKCARKARHKRKGKHHKRCRGKKKHRKHPAHRS